MSLPAGAFGSFGGQAAVIEPDDTPWSIASRAAALLAVDPVRLGGAVIRAQPGPVRDAWLSAFRDLLPPDAPWRRIPLHVADARLLGGLDLAATLSAGRPVAERGILAESDGGVVLLPMAERISPSAAARITAVMDSGEVKLERDGLGHRQRTAFGVIALDEGIADDELPPTGLVERLAFWIDLTGVDPRDPCMPVFAPFDLHAVRADVARVTGDDEVLSALCAAASALGIRSGRAPFLALWAAKINAALEGRDAVAQADAAVATALVLAPRATQLPVLEPQQDEQEEPEDKDEPPEEAPDDDRDDEAAGDESFDDIVLSAAKASMPAGLLARLKAGDMGRTKGSSAGRAGAKHRSRLRGRPIGSRPGDLRTGSRLDVIDTLRSAAPWQKLRRRETTTADETAKPPRVDVRREDFRITQYKHRAETATIFVVDASGSAALHRLAEAKGAVELLLADCYARRDNVALIAFRGKGAELLLPPTRSLVRAKRSLAGLPGGGGTPLAAGIDAALELAESVRRKGQTPTMILLTDGRANIARDQTGGRSGAENDAIDAARMIRAAGVTALVVDTSPRSHHFAERLATEMRASYLPLPHADAAVLSNAVRRTSGPAAPRADAMA